MNRLVPAALAASVVACAACASASRPIDVEAEIRRLDAEWSRAAGSRDVERSVSFWSADASVFPPGGPPVEGKAAIREFVTKSFQTPGFSISWKTTTVVVSAGGDMAYTTGSNRVTFAALDGKAVTVDGKAVEVWRRQKDGQWKCVIDIWNDAAPPPQ